MRYKNEESFSQKAMADAIYKKLEEYLPIIDANSCVSAVLDPRTKLSVFLTDIEKNKVKDSINKLAEHYSTTSSTSITSSTTGNELADTRNYFRKLCNININIDVNNVTGSNNLAGDLKKIYFT